MEDLVVSPEFWRRKRVFVTGHTGFKGGWLCLWLQDLGAEVTGYALDPPTKPSLFEEARVAEGMHSIIGDVRDAAALQKAILESNAEIVFHLAAQPLVRESYTAPVETYSINVMGTVHLLEALRNSQSVKAAVIVTTDKCYENREWVWGYREEEPLGGRDPYSSSKACAELITTAYRKSYFSAGAHAARNVAVATARAGNVIGGGDWAKDRLVPDLLAAFATRSPAHIRNPGAIRPWQHVLEPLHGYLCLAERLYVSGGEFAEAWNFGPKEDDARPVSWIADRLADLWGPPAVWEAAVCKHLFETTYLRLDSSKARIQLNWRPAFDLERALQLTIEWFRSQIASEDMRARTLEQVRAYQALACC